MFMLLKLFSFTSPALVNNLSSSVNPNIQVTCTLGNTGSVGGAEVAQVYLGFPSGSGEPPHRLVGWQKVTLQPGASQSVTIEVDQNDSSHPLSYWNETSGAWIVAPGQYTVYLGDSLTTLTTVGTFTVGS